jgi:hypothetical protein
VAAEADAEDAEVDAVTADEGVLLAISDPVGVEDALASLDDSVDVSELVASVGEEVAIWANTGRMAENRTTAARMTVAVIHANDTEKLFI